MFELFEPYGSTGYRYKSCRRCYNEAAKAKSNAAYKKNPELLAARQREYRKKRRDGIPPRTKLTPEEYKAKRSAQNKALQIRLRAETFDAYGGRICVCCGEKNERFLTLDHIAGDGAQKRREARISGGWNYFRNLRAKGWPPGYQVLCFNCNCGRAYNGGICPHQQQHEGQ